MKLGVKKNVGNKAKMTKDVWIPSKGKEKGRKAFAMIAGVVATIGTAQTRRGKERAEREAKVRETKSGKEKVRNNGREREKAKGKVHAGSADVCACREIARPVGAGQGTKRDPSVIPSKASSDALRP